MFLKAEVFDDLTGTAGEALDVVGQVGSDVVGITLQLLEGELARIVEGLPGYLVEDRLNVLDLAVFKALELGKDGILGGLQAHSRAAEARSWAASRPCTDLVGTAHEAGRPPTI